MSKREDLPPDPDAVEKWKRLPQTERSKSALPPMTGGLGTNRALLWSVLFIGVITAIFILSQLVGK